MVLDVAVRKRGRVSGSNRVAELAEQISECAVGEAESSRDFAYRVPLDDDGTDRFIASLLEAMWCGEERWESRVIHDATSKMSLATRSERLQTGTLNFQDRECDEKRLE